MPSRGSDHVGESKAYQSRGVGARDAEQSDGGVDILGRGGIGAQAVNGGARSGELLGGTEAGAGDTSGHHCELSARRASGRVESCDGR